MTILHPAFESPRHPRGTGSEPEAASPRADDGLLPGEPVDPAARPLASVDGDATTDEFGDLVCMASQLLDCPIALIAVAEGDHFRMAAERGIGKLLVAREHAICRALSHETRLLILPDAAADPRFRDDPLVACADGVRFYLGIALFGSSGQLLGVLSVADRQPRAVVSEDVLTMLHRLARLAEKLIERCFLERSHRIAEQLTQAAFSAVLVVDSTGAITFANAAAHAMFGASVSSGSAVHALFPSSLQPDADAVACWLHIDPVAGNSSPTFSELRVRSAEGDLRTLEGVRCNWPGGVGDVMALILRDVTEAVRQQRDRPSAQQDPLTGLPTHSALLATLDQLRPLGAPLGVALLGLDNFRSVNDTLGHGVGDAVLQIVACRLLGRLPANAHLARFGGDEFALVFPATDVDAIETRLQAMLCELAWPCEVDNQRVHIEASIGLVMDEPGVAAVRSANEGSDVSAVTGSSELVTRAALALQHAKRARGQRLRRFEPAMRAEAVDRRELDLELRRAFRDDEFELHYQPQIDLESGRPTGAEALLRWRHPERGLLPPVAFIDALSHSTVATSVGRWILERACRDAAAWPEVDGRRLSIGVNLFQVQLDDTNFLHDVDHALATSGLPAAQLELELTETIALRDDGSAEQVLFQLRARGIRVAYDDFGTGYASLAMLHRLPVDRIKIDRSFVRNVMENRGDAAIVRSIVLIGHNFDLQVIAEGVETPFQAEMLRGLGCQQSQGFLYSKPLSSADFDRWLATQIDARPGKVKAYG